MTDTRQEPSARVNETPLATLNDFSLMSGGPLFQLLRRMRLSGDALEMVRRRVLLAVLLTWPPLLVLSIVEGNAWGGGVALPFLHDVETHLRLLVAAPLLILAEILAHRVLPQVVRQFEANGLIRDEARPRFDAAIASALRLRNSVVAELLLILFVYAVGVPFVWRDQVALDVHSWFASAAGGRLQPTLAGWWLGLVSMPLLQFLALRWYFRVFIWWRFLWQVARTGLSLEPTHPDRTAGLLFLARSGRAYRLLLLALGTVLSGMIANRIFQEGATLVQFKVEIVGTVLLALFIVLGPLVVFYPQLRAVRRRGMMEYGALGQVYAREFNRKWLRGTLPTDEPLLGHADFQSLADLYNGYEVVRGVRLLPFTTKNVTSLAAFVLLPVAPLVLTMVSVEQLVDRMLKTLL
jgi:hypothetical protein